MKGIVLRGFTFCAVLYVSLFCTLEASLKSYFVDELCHETSRVVFSSTTSATSGVVQFLASAQKAVDCEIVWRTGYKISPVLSIVSYNLHPEDELTITDSDRFSVKVVGSGYFPDERKAFVSEGDLTVRFKSNHTEVHSFDKVKFHFVYTMTRKGPCSFNDYECNNGKCIDESLVCDSHNHCGDRSDQKKCGLIRENIGGAEDEYVVRRQLNTIPIIVVVVVSVLIIILIIVIIVLAVRLRRKSQAVQTASPTAVATGSSDYQPARPSVFTVLRNSIRRKNRNEEIAMAEQQQSDSYQVPSMYPQIPSAPDISSVENQGFKIEE